jgi:hypothetical protein
VKLGLLEIQRIELRVGYFANVACGVLLLTVALAAELISLAHGGPAYDVRSGNVPGGILAIAMATFVCLLGCLIARQLILRRMRRNLDVRGRWTSG